MAILVVGMGIILLRAYYYPAESQIESPQTSNMQATQMPPTDMHKHKHKYTDTNRSECLSSKWILSDAINKYSMSCKLSEVLPTLIKYFKIGARECLCHCRIEYCVRQKYLEALANYPPWQNILTQVRENVFLPTIEYWVRQNTLKQYLTKILQNLAHADEIPAVSEFCLVVPAENTWKLFTLIKILCHSHKTMSFCQLLNARYLSKILESCLQSYATVQQVTFVWLNVRCLLKIL